MTNIGIHQSHCCAAHGCKYGSRGCPVEDLVVIQDFPCEYCAPLDDEFVEFAVQQFDAASQMWFTPESVWYTEVAPCVLAYRRRLGYAREGQRFRMAVRRVQPERGFGDTGVLTSKPI